METDKMKLTKLRLIKAFNEAIKKSPDTHQTPTDKFGLIMKIVSSKFEPELTTPKWYEDTINILIKDNRTIEDRIKYQL